MAGVLFLNDRDVETDFSLVVSAMAGFPGILGSGAREIPLLDGPEMSDAILDPRLMRRKQGTALVRGFINAASLAAMETALDALKGTVLGGEFAVRTGYASDRQCFAVCDKVDAEAYSGETMNGRLSVSLSFTVKNGVAERIVPDGYALSTARTSCPIWTAESRPVILVHGGGASVTNPVITVRNAAGDIVQTMSFTGVIGATAALRVDCARALTSLITAGAITDAVAAGYWPPNSGDYPVLRPYDGNIEAGAYPIVELSASSGGPPVGRIDYTRRAG